MPGQNQSLGEVMIGYNGDGEPLYGMPGGGGGAPTTPVVGYGDNGQPTYGADFNDPNVLQNLRMAFKETHNMSDDQLRSYLQNAGVKSGSFQLGDNITSNNGAYPLTRILDNKKQWYDTVAPLAIAGAAGLAAAGAGVAGGAGAGLDSVGAGATEFGGETALQGSSYLTPGTNGALDFTGSGLSDMSNTNPSNYAPDAPGGNTPNVQYGNGDPLVNDPNTFSTNGLTPQEIKNGYRIVDGAKKLVNATSGNNFGGNMGILQDILGAATPLIGAAINYNNSADTNGLIKSAVQSSDLANSITADQWNYYLQNYRPAETAYTQRAMAAGSPEEKERARGAANADVTNAYDAAGKATANRMQSFGINPSSPAYQATLSSGDLSKGAAMAGSTTMADRATQSRADSMLQDVSNMGRGVPSNAAASLNSNAAGKANLASTGQRVNAANAAVTGYGLNSVGNLVGKAADWFGAGKYGNAAATASSTPGFGGVNDVVGSTPDYLNQIDNDIIPFADGGAVIDAKRTGKGTYDATGLDSVLHKRGMNTEMRSRVITPHLRRFAQGGAVDDQMGLDDVSQTSEPVQGQGTETSDSIPAQIDGQQPAALSNGEFVMSAPVLKMTGADILKAINDAGLQRRDAGLEDAPMNSNEVPANDGVYADGGKVDRPIDLRTGKPATEPPPGSHVVDPYRTISVPAADYTGRDYGKRGTDADARQRMRGYASGGRVYAQAGL